MEFEFGMRFKVVAEGADSNDRVERLGEAGCADAVLGTGQPGRVALDFTREARSVKDAIISALRDVKKVLPNAELIEVTQPETHRSVRSRQRVSGIAHGGRTHRK
jgi:hypothetical protein